MNIITKQKKQFRDNQGNLFGSDGSVIFGGINYSKRKLGKNKKGGLGINAQYRRLENFPLTVSPYVNLLNGIITYQPSFTRQASYRMLARYQAPAQAIGEQGISGRNYLFTF